eukprot:9664746-Karenia_brevis.AAC.1
MEIFGKSSPPLFLLEGHIPYESAKPRAMLLMTSNTWPNTPKNLKRPSIMIRQTGSRIKLVPFTRSSSEYIWLPWISRDPLPFVCSSDT